ncbi:hypothetical protein CY34DRAFT_15385 [Suillus luteus UH-Slu-Lm8-n1]|uniref:Uncharacterized protein n=1 Tax=Suillus luteus UH-Slu-Lm8-n1 TaxID=930992 RepID=A0A0D0AUC2_9AGAM|nr:hypothetical protein CY34DRAFT_15385 [Suillus luteus UH-Slu-Lm8-n1]
MAQTDSDGGQAFSTILIQYQPCCKEPCDLIKVHLLPSDLLEAQVLFSIPHPTLLISLPRVFIWIKAYTHITSISDIVPASTLASHAQFFGPSLLFRRMI